MKQEELKDKEEKGEGVVVYTGEECNVDCRFGKTGSSS